MYCQMCGKEIPDDSGFCPNCGAKVEADPFAETNQQANAVSQPEETSQEIEPEVIPDGMKRCTNCGALIPSDSFFCPECRSQLVAQPVQQQPVHQQRINPTPSGPISPEEEARLKKRNKILGISVAAALAVCVVIIVLSSIIKPSINLNW